MIRLASHCLLALLLGVIGIRHEVWAQGMFENETPATTNRAIAEEAKTNTPILSPDPTNESAATKPKLLPLTPATEQRPKPHQEYVALAKLFETNALPTFSQQTSNSGAESVPQVIVGDPMLIPKLSAGNEETVSLHMSDVDVVRVLEMLSRSYQMNIIVAPNVSGTVTANFEGVSPEIALQGILRLCSLSSYVDNGLIYIYPENSLPVSHRPVRIFPLDFLSATAILPSVKTLLSASGTVNELMVDAEDDRRSQEALVVVDDMESIARVEQYLLQLDQPPRQVLIEANVLEILLSNDKRHGVNFTQLLGGDVSLDFTGIANPVAGSALFARINGSDVQGLIECLQTTQDTRTLATPKIMVINGHDARIQVGEQLGFKVLTVTQTSTVEDVRFLDTGVVLEVTPQISRDHRILLNVKPQVSSGRISTTTELPESETRELMTSVLLNDGQGVVIGGLIQEKDNITVKKIPLLGDIRYIGALFQRREKLLSRSEIVVTLVPHIIDCDTCQTDDELGQLERSQMPVVMPNLRRFPRPEPRMPDSIDGPTRPLFGR